MMVVRGQPEAQGPAAKVMVKCAGKPDHPHGHPQPQRGADGLQPANAPLALGGSQGADGLGHEVEQWGRGLGMCDETHTESFDDCAPARSFASRSRHAGGRLWAVL